MSTKGDLACIYSALILVDGDVTVTGEKIQTLLKVAGVDVEPALEGINVKDLITNVGSGVGGAAPAAGGAVPAGGGGQAAAAPVAEKKDEKKKEESENESDDDTGCGLFD